MARLLADEDFDLRVVHEIRRLEHDVITVQEIGLGNCGLRDFDVPLKARRSYRIHITFNRRDFIDHHKQSNDHFGIIVATRDSNFANLSARIHKALVENSLMSGLLIRIKRP